MPTRRHRWRTLGTLAVVATSLCVATPAMAAKPGSSSAGSGSCSVSPNSVAVGASWTLTGSNLGAYALVNVLITDSAGGINSWNLQADATGTTSVTWHSYASGATSVKFMKSARHGSSTVAACSFTVT